MRKLVIVCAAFLSLNAYAQEAYEGQLTKIMNQVDTSRTLPQLMPLSAQLDMIAGSNPTSWQANYYAAFTKVIISYYETDMARKDLFIDEADNFFSVIQGLKVENDEKYVLAALIANGRLSVDGANRWKKYGPIFEENLKKAKELNIDNPHIYYLLGTSKFYTPKMFGGGSKVAKPYFEKAKELYAKLDTKNIMIPYWGFYMNEYFLGECNK